MSNDDGVDESTGADGVTAPAVTAADLTGNLAITAPVDRPGIAAAAPTPAISPAPVPASIPAAKTPQALPAPTPTRIGAPSTAPARPRNDPHRFGRIDDDGNAFLITPDGEVPIGQWAAGTIEEGYQFFGVKYDDLLVEVDLARQRLADGRGTADQALSAVAHIRQALEAPVFMGDVVALHTACAEIDGLIAQARKAEQDKKKAIREQARARREQIITESESLSTSTQWKATGERFAELLEEWKAAPRVDRAFEQAMWQRFSSARTAFDKARRAHFAQRDAQRREAIAGKEKLIAEATALSTSTDWAGTSRELRRLMDRWKAAGNAGRKVEDQLWQRFRAAQDVFFAARDAANAERDVELKANLALKEELVAEAEALLPITDVAKAKKALRSISERWEAIGHVPRADRDRVESRFRKVEDAAKEKDQQAWRNSNPESRARASDTAEKFRAALVKAQQDRERCLETGDQRGVADADGRIATMTALLAAAEGALADFSR